MKKYYFITLQKIWLIVCILVIVCIIIFYTLACFTLLSWKFYEVFYTLAVLLPLTFPSFISAFPEAKLIDKKWAMLRFIKSYNIVGCCFVVMFGRFIHEWMITTGHEMIGYGILACLAGMISTLITRTVKVFFAPTPIKDGMTS